jgi:hypothetical protein
MKLMKYITLFAAIGSCHLFAHEQEEATVVCEEEGQQDSAVAHKERKKNEQDTSIATREEGETPTVHLE